MHRSPPPPRNPAHYRPSRQRQDPQDPSGRPEPRGRPVRDKILDVGEKIAGALMDVAAEAVNEGVQSAVDTVLGRAERAASQAAQTIGFMRKVRRGGSADR